MADTDRMQKRLDELDERIEKARHAAEEHDLLPDSTPEATFIEPDGDDPTPEPEGDDPALAPG